MGTIPRIGGQAVMEGVMMHHGEAWAMAVRRPDGSIAVERHPWFRLTGCALLRRPLLRGFPILIETLVNGVRCLNRSTSYAVQGETGQELKSWQLMLTLLVSLLLAVGLFVLLPHLLSMVMHWLDLGGDVDGVVFHLWDGLFKVVILLGYLVAIGFMPDIRRVFCYHGAEHKTLAAFESGGVVSADTARRFSRLHPRCGTTFLLFVLVVAVLAHTVLVPALLLVWTPESFWLKHALTVLFKLALLVPISCLSYEIILYAARMGDGVCGRCLRAPGLLLQRLTTREPDRTQLEVAIAALAAVLGPEAGDRLVVPPDVIHVPLLPRS